jgi:hypothetical protein
MSDIKFVRHTPEGSPADGLLSAEQCLQRAEDCEQLGMTELAAKWRQLAEQTRKVQAAAHDDHRSAPDGSRY